MAIAIVVMGTVPVRWSLRATAAIQPVVIGPEGAELDSVLVRLTAFGFSGQVLVARNGVIVLHKGYGLADRARRVPVTTSTLFDIGSRTKEIRACRHFSRRCDVATAVY
jgi:CubicO group peptidase (beta-lactamase class C family)